MAGALWGKIGKVCQSRSDVGKLASYEVAGQRGKNDFVPEGTAELPECFPTSFQDAIFCGNDFQPLRSWLISGCPFGTWKMYETVFQSQRD
jgi:hypothetical protein